MPSGRKVKTGRGTIVKTVPFRDDPIVMARLDEVARLWATGLSITASVEPLNQWLTSKGFASVSRQTVGDDRRRLSTLAREAHPQAQEEHSLKMQHLTARLYDRIAEIQAQPGSTCKACGAKCGHFSSDQAEAQLWSVLQRALAEYAKVDGAVVTRIETRIERTAAEAVKILVLQVLPEHGIPEDTILTILDDARVQALEPHKGEDEAL